jgi:hypothetical protein
MLWSAPIVETWDLPAAPIDAVAGFDNYAAGVAVARHLLAQGRQSLAFIGGDDPRATRPARGDRFQPAALCCYHVDFPVRAAAPDGFLLSGCPSVLPVGNFSRIF